jgi:hypothetical protein
MIRGAIVHITNEQPLRVDLPALPTAGDVCLICTNVRLLSGRLPSFIDAADSLVVFPLDHIRFLEIPARSLGEGAPGYDLAGERVEEAEAEPELVLDEDLLRRIRET